MNTKALSASPISLDQPWLIDLSHLLLVVSASCNVIIYTAQVGKHHCNLSYRSFIQDVRFRNLLVSDLKRLLLLYRKNSARSYFFSFYNICLERSYFHILHGKYVTDAPYCVRSREKIFFRNLFAKKRHFLTFMCFLRSRIPSPEEPLSLTTVGGTSLPRAATSTRINNYPKANRFSSYFPKSLLFFI